VTPTEYDYLRRLLKERSGLVLAADKHYLVESRLLPIARKAGAAGLGGLVLQLNAANADGLASEVVEAMTTNETFFFRDKTPFDQFANVIMPALIAARAHKRRIRIWSAAASTGQEPYSLAICAKEIAARLAGWHIEILATDLSSEALARAQAGVYTQFEVQRGLPIHLLLKYFTQVGEMWQIAPELRAMIEFRPFNLLHAFASLGTFDVIFCRNVLIYFGVDTKTDVLERLARVTAPDGYLSLGAAETVVGLTEALRAIPDRRGLYAPNAAALHGASGVVVDFSKPRVAAGGSAR
jgi:chemotaxis protein methyltransferase CheR